MENSGERGLDQLTVGTSIADASAIARASAQNDGKKRRERERGEKSAKRAEARVISASRARGTYTPLLLTINRPALA